MIIVALLAALGVALMVVGLPLDTAAGVKFGGVIAFIGFVCCAAAIFYARYLRRDR